MKKEIFCCDICGEEVPDVIQITIPVVKVLPDDKIIQSSMKKRKRIEYFRTHVDACSTCAEEISKTIRGLCCDETLARLYYSEGEGTR